MGTSTAVIRRDPGAARRHAILCVLSASAIFTCGAAVVKALTADFPVMEIVSVRSFVAFMALTPLLWRQGGIAALVTRRPLGHALRTLCGFVATATTVYGYAVLPLATVTALGFAMPLFLTVLSVPLLGERIGPRRSGAVVAGLGGVLLMLRPWQHSTGLPLLAVSIVLAGVVAWALAMISIRRMGEAGERNVTIVAWYSLGTAMLAAIAAAPQAVVPSVPQAVALLAAGLCSGAAQLLMTEGYRSGETSLLAPFEYGAIVYATALGIVLWGEWPDGWGMLGVAVLICAGLYIWRREAALGIRH